MSEHEDDSDESVDSASGHSGEEQDNEDMSSDEVEDGSQISASEEEHDVEMQSSGEDNGEDSESESKDVVEESTGNAGWADAISKVLRTNKPKSKKTLVLSRAKKINDPRYINDEPRLEGPGFDIDGEIKEESDVKPDVELPSVTSAKEKELKRKVSNFSA
jgi:hypothetical protein